MFVNVIIYKFYNIFCKIHVEDYAKKKTNNQLINDRLQIYTDHDYCFSNTFKNRSSSCDRANKILSCKNKFFFKNTTNDRFENRENNENDLQSYFKHSKNFENNLCDINHFTVFQNDPFDLKKKGF